MNFVAYVPGSRAHGSSWPSDELTQVRVPDDATGLGDSLIGDAAGDVGDGTPPADEHDARTTAANEITNRSYIVKAATFSIGDDDHGTGAEHRQRRHILHALRNRR
ncbi:MAG TPA: hypothetical protein VFH98_02395 [Candidatus Limnocylindria bacterium]|jgi:hypothetical protein|nr:hypothetical protein [Candidatus Limnocylindria bacterium]